jgi:hypothetical protein
LVIHFVLSLCAWVLGPSDLRGTFDVFALGGALGFFGLNLPGVLILGPYVDRIPTDPFWHRSAIDLSIFAITQGVLFTLLLLVWFVRTRMLPNRTIERDARKSGARPSL